MGNIKEKLGKAGLLVAALGIISAVLSIFNYNLRWLAWVDLWGTAMGWIIRILLIITGGALFFFYGVDEEEK